MRPRPRIRLSWIPSLLLGGWLMLAWPIGGAVEGIGKWLDVTVNPTIHGQQLKKKLLRPTPENLWSGDFQKSFEAWLPKKLPLRGMMVRATNQLYYSLLGHSAMGGDNPIIIGKDNQLFTMSYLLTYCNTRRLTSNVDTLNTRAVTLKRIQDWFKSRGKSFIYMVSPSKAAYYPEYIPSGFGCKEGSTRPNYHAGVKAAQIAGLNLVDNSALIIERKGQAATPLFPRGGIHYNQEGAVMATNHLLETIARLRGKGTTTIEYDVSVVDTAEGSDADLLDLLNLVYPNKYYPAAKLNITKTPDILPFSIAFIGGSFVMQPIQLLEKLSIFPIMYHYSYYKLAKITYPGQDVSTLPEESGRDYDDIFDADIIVLEENEEAIPSNHAEAFIQEALRRMH
jgi:hypothetical protein